MYPTEFEYFAPNTIQEALDLLERYGDEAKVLAGGQSLIPMMKLRIASPRYLVDLNRIHLLDGFQPSGDRLLIGALCRHAGVADAPLAGTRLTLMSDAAHLTADVQVRNRGTLAGSLAHADPAGDWPTALLALDADVEITGKTGVRTVALNDFLVDAYTTQLQPNELLTRISVPFGRPGSGGAYVKFEKRAGDFAVASVGVQLTLDHTELCSHIAISLGAVGPRPIRADAAERLLSGEAISPRLLVEAETLVRSAAQPFEDTRGSVEYKRHLTGVLFRRAFAAATRRARGQHVETVHL